MTRDAGNLGSAERWGSIIAGLGLTLAALSRGSALSRVIAGATGLSLLSRGAAGHCAMKAALSGESTLREGLQQQWQRTRAAITQSSAAQIDSMEALYTAELQELHSAESQLCALLEDLPETFPNRALERQLRGYATEVRTRRADLERILASSGRNPRAHPDQGMQALLGETRKMAQVCAESVREAALIASLQRLLHYKIAGYGTVATYAKILGNVDDAARFADFGDRDKAVDAELSTLAIEVIDPQAKAQPSADAGRGAGPTEIPTLRPH